MLPHLYYARLCGVHDGCWRSTLRGSPSRGGTVVRLPCLSALCDYPYVSYRKGSFQLWLRYPQSLITDQHNHRDGKIESLSDPHTCYTCATHGRNNVRRACI